MRIFGSVMSQNYAAGFTATSNGQVVAVTRGFKTGELDGYSLITLRIAPRLEKEARVIVNYDHDAGALYFTHTPVFP